MMTLMKPLQLTPVIDKEYAIVIGEGYNQTITDGLVVVGHIENKLLPTYQPVTDAITNAGKDALAQEGNIFYMGLWQTKMINHFTLVSAWKSADAKMTHDLSPNTLRLKDIVYPTGATIGGCVWDEQFSFLQQTTPSSVG